MNNAIYDALNLVRTHNPNHLSIDELDELKHYPEEMIEELIDIVKTYVMDFKTFECIRDMESAPKDGTRILLRYALEEEKREDVWITAVWSKENSKGFPQWRECCGTLGIAPLNYIPNGKCLNWMPLP